jgi:hypothetical protein
MRIRPITAAIAILVLSGVAAYAVWAVRAASRLGAGWAGLDTAWPYLLAGVLTVAVVIAVFLRLAFWSQSRGFDDRADDVARKNAQPPRS